MDERQARRVLGWDGVEPLKRCWRRAARKHHPDRGGSQAVFERKRRAYEVLLEASREPRSRPRGQRPRQSNDIGFGTCFVLEALELDGAVVKLGDGARTVLRQGRDGPEMQVEIGRTWTGGSRRCVAVVHHRGQRAVLRGRVTSRSHNDDGVYAFVFVTW